MDVVTTSLEALIQRATNPQNEKPDVAAIEAFCVMLGKESKGVHVASKLLSTQIQSTSEKEALQALILLDTCMKKCGRSFHTEVCKFRFLNVMVKLVSPKYLGNTTPSAVRQKILELLYAWTRDYPKELKIKETYDMLKIQGVVTEEVSPTRHIADDIAKPAKVKNPIFEDEEKAKLLQKLLQSKDPFDLKLANKLIKTMVKDDEKRLQEQNSQRSMELESVHNNAKLLSEMLDSYDPVRSSTEDVELMKEIYEACERLEPTVRRLAYENKDNDEVLYEVLAANEELTQVLEKYMSIIKIGQSSRGSRGLPSVSSIANNVTPSLLDLSSPMDLIATTMNYNKKSEDYGKPKSDIEMLGDIFSSLGNSVDPSSSMTDETLLLADANIMQPISILTTARTKESHGLTVKIDSKAKALEDLNQLGESLLKESLSNSASIARGNLNNVSKPMKDVENSDKQISHLMYVNPISQTSSFASNLSKDSLQKPIAATTLNGLGDNGRRDLADFSDLLDDDDDDDAMLDSSSVEPAIRDTAQPKINDKECEERVSPSKTTETEVVKPLGDIHVTIDNIKPGSIPPLTVIEEKNGISVVLHFAKGSPRPDVTVVVVTTMSKNSKALSNYLFQAVVPKNCKCRLQAPSGTELPGHNPFLPPSAITQIMLIANPQKDPLSLKFMLSYTMDDETLTEMGEVDKLPTV